jgi:ABC-type polysaccharide/polyol phosphate export permease
VIQVRIDLKFLGSVLLVILFCVTPLVYMAWNLDEKKPDEQAEKWE